MKIFWKKILGHRVTIKALSLLIFLYLWFVYISSKKIIIYPKQFSKNLSKKLPSICVFWHNRLALMAFLIVSFKERPMNVLSSPHGDGLIISNVMKLFRIKTIIGSTNRNAISALRMIQSKLKSKEHIAITPDGPRGPMYQINSSLVRIASKNRITIAPLTYGAARTRIFKSWDKFIMPLPFNKLVFVHGNPIHGHKASNAALKQELDRITNLADNLANQKS